MKRIMAGCILLAGLGACNEKPAAVSTPAAELKTEDDKTLYAMGVMMGQSLKMLNLAPSEVALVKRGLDDMATGAQPQVDVATYQPKLQDFARRRMEKGAETQRSSDGLFAEKAAKESGAQRLPSGMVIQTLTPGNGPSPTASSKVKVHYEGRLTNGTVFDSSIKRGQPAEFPLSDVIPCWTEGLQKMKVGEKAKLVCPSNLAYGDQGRPPTIPGGSTLIFEVQLLEVH